MVMQVSLLKCKYFEGNRVGDQMGRERERTRGEREMVKSLRLKDWRPGVTSAQRNVFWAPSQSNTCSHPNTNTHTHTQPSLGEIDTFTHPNTHRCSAHTCAHTHTPSLIPLPLGWYTSSHTLTHPYTAWAPQPLWCLVLRASWAPQPLWCLVLSSYLSLLSMVQWLSTAPAFSGTGWGAIGAVFRRALCWHFGVTAWFTATQQFLTALTNSSWSHILQLCLKKALKCTPCVAGWLRWGMRINTSQS